MYIQTYPVRVHHSALQISRLSIKRTSQKTERNTRNKRCSLFRESIVFCFIFGVKTIQYEPYDTLRNCHMDRIHREKLIITVHPTFWRLVQKIKFNHQKYLVLYIHVAEPHAQTLRVISIEKDTYFLHRPSPNNDSLVS